VVGADPVSGPSDETDAVPATRSNLTLRIASAVVLAPLAIGTACFGGIPFALLWSVAAAAVLWEWVALVTGPAWRLAGIPYAAVLALAPILLRADAGFGLFAILYLFAIVWATDICGYFAGRAIGGPKLAPAISPKKTWSGAIAGVVAAVVAALLVAQWFGAAKFGPIAGIALLLSVMAQCGDLFESWIKRRFGFKDASQIIPGHGGVMDRLDGFWAAALVGAVIGIARGGFDDAAHGLLVW